MPVAPIVVHESPAEAQIDYGRLMRCIMALEATMWKRPGGALGFTRKAWKEDAGALPYGNACDSTYAFIVAEKRLQRTCAWLRARGYDATPERLGLAWRFGFAGSVGASQYFKDADYGIRVSNLYFDKSFSP